MRSISGKRYFFRQSRVYVNGLICIRWILPDKWIVIHESASFSWHWIHSVSDFDVFDMESLSLKWKKTLRPMTGCNELVMFLDKPSSRTLVHTEFNYFSSRVHRLLIENKRVSLSHVKCSMLLNSGRKNKRVFWLNNVRGVFFFSRRFQFDHWYCYESAEERILWTLNPYETKESWHVITIKITWILKRPSPHPMFLHSFCVEKGIVDQWWEAVKCSF